MIEEIGDCTLYLGDSRDILPALPAMLDIDLILTDPPYGLKEAAGKNKSRGGLAAPRDYVSLDWDDKPIDQEFMDFIISDISDYQIIFGGNYYSMPPTSCILVWDKCNGTTDFADCELAWTNLKKAVRLKKWLWDGFKQQRRGRFEEERFHPTQKPVEIMKWCISMAPDTVKTVCDPFAGAFTTAIACIDMGKKFIGIEREKEYFDIGAKRINEYYRQGRLL